MALNAGRSFFLANASLNRLKVKVEETGTWSLNRMLGWDSYVSEVKPRGMDSTLYSLQR